MDAMPARDAHYDDRSIALHWVTAALVVALWLLGQTIDFFPRGDARTAARSVHIVLGVLLAFVLAARIVHRYGPAGVRLPRAGLGRLDRVATGTHHLLYALLVATVLVGLANTWVRGDSIFGLFRIPAFDPGNKPLRETVQEVHELCANALFAVALFHASAALLHHYLWKDGVLRRMLPLRR